MSLMARDSASEKAEGPLYVSVHGTSELPTPPKFASKFRLVSTPKQRDAVRVQILSFSLPELFLSTYLCRMTMDLFSCSSARADPLGKKKRIIKRIIKYSVLHLNKSKGQRKCRKRNK